MRIGFAPESARDSTCRWRVRRRRPSRTRPGPRVALVGADYIGLKPTLLVQPGDRVLRGTPLFDDKKRHRRPLRRAGGRDRRGDSPRRDARVPVARHRRGSGRRSRGAVAFASFPGAPPGAGRRSTPSARCSSNSGMWTAFRARPSRACRRRTPHRNSIFVTAIDTHPHAPAVDVALAERTADFHAGLDAIAGLCRGKTYVCTAAGSAVTAPVSERIVVEEFAGPHPTGTPACTSTCWTPSTWARPSGTSATRTSPRSGGSSRPGSSTSSA